jgi:hypothetical protein
MKRLERFRAKHALGLLTRGWTLVCIKKTRQIKKSERVCDSIKSERVLALAIILFISPALAQTGGPDCRPIGQTARGEMVYGLDCKAIKAETTGANLETNMPKTNLPETVIPKAGATEMPPEKPPVGEAK